MPRLQFSTIYSTVESITNVTNQRALVKNAIQWGLDELTSKDLPFLNDESFFTTIAPYTTGTVSATNGSKTITGSGTTFTVDMVGRKIRIDNQSAYYRIAAFVSTTEITLEAPYSGSTVSAKTYSVYKDEYRLSADVDTYKVLRQIEDNRALGSLDSTSFDFINPDPSHEGIPSFEILIGTKLDTYETGTVSGTVNNSVITGSGTVWTGVQGLSRGTRITVGSVVYTVKSVDSDTQVTIYEKIASTFSTSAYIISLDNLIVQLDAIPDDAQNIYYKYQRLAFPLINDQDIPDLPEQYHHLLVEHGLYWTWLTKDKVQAQSHFVIFERGKNAMWKRIGHPSSTRSYPRASQDSLYGSTLQNQPRPPRNYGVPLEL
jgi:hypothetical protein